MFVLPWFSVCSYCCVIYTQTHTYTHTHTHAHTFQHNKHTSPSPYNKSNIVRSFHIFKKQASIFQTSGYRRIYSHGWQFKSLIPNLKREVNRIASLGMRVDRRCPSRIDWGAANYDQDYLNGSSQVWGVICLDPFIQIWMGDFIEGSGNDKSSKKGGLAFIFINSA